MFSQIFIFVFGLVFGSFVTAFSWRYPRGISIKKGRSYCPRCKKQINWYDNIPLLSFLLLLGRCRHCRKKISFRYPVIESVAAFGFLFIWNAGGDLFEIIYKLFIFLIMVSIFAIDLEHQIIPDGLVFSALSVTILRLLLTDDIQIYQIALTGFIASSLLLFLHIFTRGKGMGLGDVKFAVFGGMLVGPSMFLVWLLLAFLTGAFAGIILILAGKARLKDHIAFGPFLIFSILLTHFFGASIAGFITL